MLPTGPKAEVDGVQPQPRVLVRESQGNPAGGRSLNLSGRWCRCRPRRLRSGDMARGYAEWAERMKAFETEGSWSIG
jgi:hypothetical protein